MINDSVNITGTLNIILRDKDGNVKQEINTKNLVVAVGKNLIASRFSSNSNSVPTHMAVGTNSASPIAGNTTLGTEIGGSRVALAVSGGTVVNNTITYTASFGAGVGTGAITEAGIFNDVTTGTMLCRTSFAPVNKDVADTLGISWNVTIS
jgi:hypothetical protein